MRQKIENSAFLGLLLLVTILFAWVLKPFWGAIFWASAITIIFYPLQSYLLAKLAGRRTLAALITLLCCLLIVMLPLLWVALEVVQQALAVYQAVQSGAMSPAVYLDQVRAAFPFIPKFLERLGVDTLDVRQKLTDVAVVASRFIGQQALSVGQNTLTSVLNMSLMLYLTFFLLRDGQALVALLVKALPLGDEREYRLFNKFAEVTRATVKGNLLVAMVQGALGGLIFAILGLPAPILWGVLMAFLSLIPAIGASLVWVPAAVYLFASGSFISATVLVLFGVLVIGLADNVLRPLLVGRDTKLPDYIVLFSTLGGLALMGINGFVLGPLVAALFMTFWQIFMLEFNDDASSL